MEELGTVDQVIDSGRIQASTIRFHTIYLTKNSTLNTDMV